MLSFAKKLFFMSIFIIVLPVTTIFFIADNANRNTLVNEFQRLNAMDVANISGNIEKVLKAMEAGAYSIQYNKDIYYTLFKYRNVSFESYRQDLAHDYNMLGEYHNITAELRSNSYLNSALKEPVSMVITPSGITFSSSQIGINDNAFVTLVSSMNKNGTDELWISSQDPLAGTLFSTQNQPTVCFFKKVLDPTGKTVIGYVTVTISKDTIYNFFDNFLAENKSGSLYLVDEHGNLIVKDEKSDIADFPSVNAGVLDKIKSDTHGAFRLTESNHDMVIAYNKIATNGWVLIYTLPIPTIMPNTYVFYNIMLPTVIIVILVAMLLAWLLGRGMSKNIHILCDTMLKVDKNDVFVKASIKSNDEIGYLTRCYNSLIDRVVESRQLLVEEQTKKLDAQRKFLQSQINAHFLYNSLNSIRVLGSMERTSEIITLTTALIKLLRATIDNSKDVISLNEEMENLINYIYIQEIRYADIFKVYYDINEDLGDCHIPKLLLQPIVENAIFHGMRDKESGGRIDIIVRKIEDGALSIKICDNGMGSAENVSKYFSNGYCTEGKVGLRNVDDRIKLYFGLHYGLSLSDNYPCGLCVEIRIPIS